MKPNVVIIYADDLGWGDLGCFGADELDTPALDGLAAQGARLTQWYANSPVCSPSRASLLTGRHPAHAGVEAILGGARDTAGLPPQSTMAGALRDRGYATGVFGKWHLGVDPAYGPLERGFDEHFGFRAGCVDYYSHIYYWDNRNPVHDLWDGEDEVWRNGEYLTTVIARKAAEFVERNAERPFLCYVPFNAPHYPMHAPEEYLAQFAHLPDGRRMTAAMIKAMDDGVATILDALDRAGLRDNTIVFMSSDNGPSIEERNWLNGEEVSYDGGSAGGLRGHKGSLFEGGIRVPAMIRWPARIPAGTRDDVIGSMADLVPTVLHAVDGAVPDDATIDGNSLLDQLTGPGDDAERWLFWEYEGQRAVRRGRWKVVEDACESMQAEVAVSAALYDLSIDEGERQDRSQEHPEQFHRMRDELRLWAQRCETWRNHGDRSS
ncbi:sulfatase-like hydrolase/transferase [Paractinoplanes lichenicola]|uniref:Sulfatase-like hydrolase/transferase n=1 Tax=Paractinoplanes lichenicola TaxID=2802976 RepID=A0ABS1VWI7_9ACTN|nr:sulfatase-like hydrolase/transferase [Actinoplanes lichenicola]MBL7258820.1 sulfatase-like hydrolase/transferase [Actinoplanes lichenicola]